MWEIQPEYFETKDCRAVNPEDFGIHGVIQLGVSRFRQMRVPTEEHIHRHMLEVGFCLRSPLTLKVFNGGEFPVMPGSFFINQPNVPHCLSSRPTGLYVFYFLLQVPPSDGTLLDLPAEESTALLARLGALPHTISSGSRAAQIGELFTRLFQICDMPQSPLTALKMRQTFLDLLVLLLELAEHPVDVPCSDRVAKVVELVRKHPERAFTIDALAREAALSPTHFINQFRKATGFPPIRFQIECRIQRAKELLRQGKATASHIASQLGFNSLQHFSDTFTRIVGQPPRQWRSK